MDGSKFGSDIATGVALGEEADPGVGVVMVVVAVVRWLC